MLISVCLSVCEQHNWSNCGPVLMKLVWQDIFPKCILYRMLSIATICCLAVA